MEDTFEPSRAGRAHFAALVSCSTETLASCSLLGNTPEGGNRPNIGAPLVMKSKTKSAAGKFAALSRALVRSGLFLVAKGRTSSCKDSASVFSSGSNSFATFSQCLKKASLISLMALGPFVTHSNTASATVLGTARPANGCTTFLASAKNSRGVQGIPIVTSRVP